MNKFLFLLLSLSCFNNVKAQKLNKAKKPTVGIQVFFKDFGTALSDFKTFSKTSDMKLGLGITYMEGITNHIDFVANANASSLNYPYKSGELVNKEAMLFEGIGKVHLKARTDDKIWNPYLHVGIGGSIHNGENFGINFPFGCGIQFKVKESSFLFTDVTYNKGLTSFTNNHLQYSLGFATAFMAKKKSAKPIVKDEVVVKDTDADGIPDVDDKCPNVAGSSKYDGCPIPDTDKDGINDEDDECIDEAGTKDNKGCPSKDTDKDGILDNDDKCPSIAGLARYNGCPIPDTDGDGVNDEEDNCPKVKGVKANKGCPIKDTDGDGVMDDVDKCPSEKGTKENNGCPELKDFNFQAKNVQFNTASDVLTSVAITELNKLSKILNEHPTINIMIEGHTDNVGDATRNLNLSQRRADAVRNYLISKGGIAASRMQAKGFGSSQPIANNAIPTGKIANRRVEFKVVK